MTDSSFGNEPRLFVTLRKLMFTYSLALVVLIDTGTAVARHLQQLLDEAHLLNTQNTIGQVSIWTNNPANHASEVIERLWREDKMIHLL